MVMVKNILNSIMRDASGSVAAGLAVAVMVSACAYDPPRSSKPSRPSQSTTEVPDAPSVSPGKEPEPGDLPTWTEDRPAAPRSPVSSLMDKADAQMDAGELDQAQATLERALRIAPYDPLVLSRLAKVKLELGSPEQAEALASKSNGLIRGDEALRDYNNQLIKAARWKQGR